MELSALERRGLIAVFAPLIPLGILMIYLDQRPPTASITADTLVVSARVGPVHRVPLTDVTVLEMTTTMPRPKRRDGGGDFSTLKHGRYVVNDTLAWVYVASDVGPFLHVTERDHSDLFIALPSPQQTEQLYQRLLDAKRQGQATQQ